MDFDRAKLIGDDGELRVRALLRDQQQSDHSCGYISNLLVAVGKATAQIDHLLIDRRGVLILEVKTWNDGYLRGTADERHWTVVYGHSQTHRHQNPLRQLASQRDTLRKALRAAGDPLDPDDLQSVVVFVGGANIDNLELSAEDRAKVTTIERLPDLLRSRCVTPSERSVWDPDTVARRHAQIQALNRSADSEAQAAHERYRQRFRDRGPAAQSAVVGTPGSQTAWPVTVTRNPPKPATPYAPRRIARPAATTPVALVLLGLLLLLFVFVMPNLMAKAIRDLTQGLASHTLPAEAVPAPSVPSAPASVEQAKSVLKQIAPQVYDHAAHLDEPAIEDKPDGLRSFTWEYVARVNKRTAAVKSFSLTLRPDGSIAGMAASD